MDCKNISGTNPSKRLITNTESEEENAISEKSIKNEGKLISKWRESAEAGNVKNRQVGEEQKVAEKSASNTGQAIAEEQKPS